MLYFEYAEILNKKTTFFPYNVYVLADTPKQARAPRFLDIQYFSAENFL